MTFEWQRLGNTIRFQRGQVGVLKLQEIVKIVGRWRGWGMMMQLVIRGDRRRVTDIGEFLVEGIQANPQEVRPVLVPQLDGHTGWNVDKHPLRMGMAC